MPNNNNPRMATDEVVEAVAHELCSEIGSDSINHAFQWDDYIRYAKAALSVIASKAVGGEVDAVERIINDRIMTYNAKISTENPTRETANEMRFAVTALQFVRSEIQATLSSLPPQSAPVEGNERAYPNLLTENEKKELLEKAENLWSTLEENKLGGYTGINRPFLILHEFKEVIEKYGKRDVGLTWSYNDLQKALPPNHAAPEETPHAR